MTKSILFKIKFWCRAGRSNSPAECVCKTALRSVLEDFIGYTQYAKRSLLKACRRAIRQYNVEQEQLSHLQNTSDNVCLRSSLLKSSSAVNCLMVKVRPECQDSCRDVRRNTTGNRLASGNIANHIVITRNSTTGSHRPPEKPHPELHPKL